MLDEERPPSTGLAGPQRTSPRASPAGRLLEPARDRELCWRSSPGPRAAGMTGAGSASRRGGSHCDRDPRCRCRPDSGSSWIPVPGSSPRPCCFGGVAGPGRCGCRPQGPARALAELRGRAGPVGPPAGVAGPPSSPTPGLPRHPRPPADRAARHSGGPQEKKRARTPRGWMSRSSSRFAAGPGCWTSALAAAGRGYPVLVVDGRLGGIRAAIRGYCRPAWCDPDAPARRAAGPGAAPQYRTGRGRVGPDRLPGQRTGVPPAEWIRAAGRAQPGRSPGGRPRRPRICRGGPGRPALGTRGGRRAGYARGLRQPGHGRAGRPGVGAADQGGLRADRGLAGTAARPWAACPYSTRPLRYGEGCRPDLAACHDCGPGRIPVPRPAVQGARTPARTPGAGLLGRRFRLRNVGCGRWAPPGNPAGGLGPRWCAAALAGPDSLGTCWRRPPGNRRAATATGGLG